nr:MAG TPA: hypothetical protein [Bacteriophage sp.]DAM02750.1 MAG TPA: hypothetical protein [Caudoviricetes sp.]
MVQLKEYLLSRHLSEMVGAFLMLIFKESDDYGNIKWNF